MKKSTKIFVSNFQNDHNGCPTCECSDPCENFQCGAGSHCEVAVDPDCSFDSSLCASEPVCKPNLVYSNPCDYGVPLADNVTAELVYCHKGKITNLLRMKFLNNKTLGFLAPIQSPEYQSRSFWDAEPVETGRSLSNTIECPADFECVKLHRESGSVCCPIQPPDSEETVDRQQSMCEYLRDFSDRMEGTEEGMTLAITPPTCKNDGMYEAQQCKKKMVKVKKADEKKLLEEKSIREMRKLLSKTSKEDVRGRSIRSTEVLEARAAKIIDLDEPVQQQELVPTNSKKKRPAENVVEANEVVEVEIEECWCVDGFGTEIPKSRSENTTLEYCEG